MRNRRWKTSALALALVCVSTVASAAQVFYSVGTAGSTDLKNGSPTVSITAGTATFSVSQPNNVGLGDEITYNGGTGAYISGRLGSSTYTVTTATGTVPADVVGATVNSITRAFDSLTAAVAGSDDVNHLANPDLVATNIQLNLVCYNDGPDPSSYVRFEDPWVTGPANYIRVFTPTLPSEVGVSQRHTGVAGTGYRIAPTGPAGIDYYNFILVNINEGYVRIEGIEVDGSGITDGENVRGMMANDGTNTLQDVRFTHNIIHDITNTTIDDTDNSRVLGIFLDNVDNAKVANNIIYNLTSVSASTQGQARGIEGDDPGRTHHVYNNTIYNIKATATTGAARGIVDVGSTIVARNNFVGLVDSVLGAEADFSGPFAAENNNVSSDGTAVGAGSVANQNAFVSYFTSITPGSEDFHLLADSSMLWSTVGADLDTDPVLPVTDDIDGETRHPTAPDIGADEVTEALGLADHSAGQVGDAFTTTTPLTAVLYGFRLSRVGIVTVDNVRVNYTTGTVIDPDVTSGELWRDVNNDGVINGGDVPIQTAVSGLGGQLAFTAIAEDPGAGTDYLVRATVSNLVAGDTTTFSLGLADIDIVQAGVLEWGAAADAVHIQDAGAGFDISGTVLEDVNGDGNLGDVVARPSSDVRLYVDGGDGQPDGVDDVFLSLMSTDPGGNYGFTSLSAGTYWVSVDSKTVTSSAGLNGGFNQGDVWPEQTYGSAGAWCDNGAGVAAELGVAGPCFGGQVSTSSDTASALSTSEHVTRVAIVASNVANVDFGFSFVVMVNTLAGDAQDDDGGANRTVQGSLRQFIQNANAVAGANVLRFVPAGPTNATDGGGNDWWRVTVITSLPAISDASTTVDGTAYSRVDGTTVVDPNPTLLGFIGSVGLGPDGLIGTADELSISGVFGPELEIVNDRATNVVLIGVDLQASSVTVRRIAIYGFGWDDLFRDTNIRVGVNSGATNFTGTLIEDSVIGSSAASYTDPGVADRTLVNDIAVFGADTGTIQNNLIGFAGRFGIFLSDTAVGWTVQGNELRANALDNASQDSLDIGNSSSGASVSGNLFVLSDGGGVDSYRGAGGNTIENNTFTQNGQVGSEPAALRIFGTGNTIRYNDIDASVGPGILIVSDIGQPGSPSIQNRISQNRFSGNGSNAIDLLALGGDASLGDGITLNDAATDPQAGNIGLDYPVIDFAVFSAGTTTVSGTSCANCDVEVYKAVASAGDTLSGTDYGEGVELAGTTTADGAGSWSVGGITNLAVSDAVSAIAIDPANNTSEFSGNVTVTNGVTLTLSDHTSGQIGDRFTNTSPVTDVLFRFRLARSGTVTISQLRVNFNVAGGVVNGDASAGELWEDVNNDGVIDGGDNLIQGAVSPVGGVLTFTTSFTPSAAGTGYLVRATVANLTGGDTTTFSVGAADIDIVEGGVNEVGTISNAVHTQDAPWTVYYSVGTSGADFKNGSPTISISSGTATLTTAQPDNVGVGDEITYNGTTKAYISGRTGPTEYTVTTATGTVPTDVAGATVNSITRAFNSLSSAQAGSSDVNHLNVTDLVTNNVQLNWACYNDGPMDDTVYVSGWTTGVDNFIRIFTPVNPIQVGTSQRHTGIAGSGYRLAPVDATQAAFNIIRVGTEYVRIEGIELDGSGLTNAVRARGVHIDEGLSNAGDFRMDMCIIHDLHTTQGTSNFDGSFGLYAFQQTSNTGPPLRLTNNVVYDITASIVEDNHHIGGFHIGSRTTSFVYNNTIYHIRNTGAAPAGATWGIEVSAWPIGTGTATVEAKNNYIGDVVSDLDIEACYEFNNNGVLNQSTNVSSDATAVGVTGQASYGTYFQSITNGSEDLHLTADSATLWGLSGEDLSSTFTHDIDAGQRVVPWDIGADDTDATTAVELLTFEAMGLDGAVELSWETGSEIDNLGFHLYRSLAEDGPFEQITASVIPGLGSSPEGARYSYRDKALTNGVTYFYRLEDIETTGRTEFHGPVSAVPADGGEERREVPSDAPASLITLGDPAANSFRVLKRGRSSVTLELVTEGFYAEPQGDGTVRLEIPGFETLTEETGPTMPVKRSWVQAIPGRKVRLVTVRARDVKAFAGLHPTDAALGEIVGSEDGTVRVKRIHKRFVRSDALLPSEAARLVSVGFQGDVKKALVELAPVRWDGRAGQLLLARRLTVRVSFRGREPSEVRGPVARVSKNVLVRLVTEQPGLYAASFEDVFGKRRAIPASKLRLSRQGETVPYHIEPRSDRFGRGSVLYFVSDGASLNPYGNRAVYELELADDGTTMESADATPAGEPVPYYWHTLRLEQNRYYQSTLVDAPDLWLWELVMANTTTSFRFDVRDLATAAGPSQMRVWLQGASDFPASPDHHVRLYVNGGFSAEMSWDGKKARMIPVELPPGALREGENVLEIENVGDTGAKYSMVMLDRFEVRFPRLPVAEGSALEGVWSESGLAELSGFSEGALVFDKSTNVTRWLTGAQVGADGVLRFRVEAGARYLAVSPSAARRPEVRRAPRTGLTRKRNRADYLIIAPEAFLPAVEPLLALRREQGLRAKSVSMEAVYSEFGFGEESPEALREFLAYAYHHWRKPPRYVVLVGDATFDFKDYLQTGVENRVPPRIIRTSYLWTASDPSYAAVNGDDILPDLAIGRLPAASLAEAQAMVQKIVAYETGGAGMSRAPIVLVADNPDLAGDFVFNADEIASGLAESSVEKIYLSELGADATRTSILRAFDAGASIVSYLGHGGIHLWASENVFNIADAPSLTSQAQQPLLVTMNCLNGYFHFPYFNALAEELLKAEDKGAIAAFSPSGLSLNAPAHRLHQALLHELFEGGHARLGDAVLAAQEVYADTGAFSELLSIYHLFGDPALRLSN